MYSYTNTADENNEKECYNTVVAMVVLRKKNATVLNKQYSFPQLKLNWRHFEVAVFGYSPLKRNRIEQFCFH